MNTHASFNESDESIECCKSNIKLIVDMITFGKGTLYVTESKLYWKNNANSQVISINYDIMCKYNVSHYPGRHKKSCLKMIVDYNYKPDEFNLNEDEEEEKFKSIIKLVPDNPECLDAIFEAIACIQPLHLSDNVVDEKNESDEHEHSDKKSNTSITSTCTEEDQELGSIDISDQYHKLDEKNGETGNQVNSIKCLDIPHSPSDSLDDNEYSHVQPLHLSDNFVDEESESDEHEDSDKKSNTSITSTYIQEDQEAGSIDISDQYHKLDEKNGETGNQVNSIKCLDISHSPSDSLDDNEYSHESENDDLELNNIKSPNIFFNISSRAPLHPDVDLDTAFEDDILLQDEEVLIRSPTSHINISSRAPLHPDVDLDTAFEDDILLQDEELLINKRKRKFEDLPEQKEKPTKIRKLWNFMKYPFQKITSFSTSISENEPNISNFSLNNSEADGENEDTSTNETSQKYCKIM